MPTTLGELSETANRNLREVISNTLMPDDAREQSVVVRQLADLVRHLQTTLESAGERPRRANPGPATHLATAQSALRRAAGRLPTLDHEIAALHHDTPLARAVQATAAVQDLIASHRGRDGNPVTPYALAFTERPARAYLVHRSAELAWGAARVAQALAETVTSDATAAQLYVTRGCLDHASVFGRAADGARNRAIEVFPLVPPLDPRPALPTDTTAGISAHLADDCERLSRTAFEALHGRGEPSLSGSDVQQLARWRAMSDLLSGRILLHAAAVPPGGPAARHHDPAPRTRGDGPPALRTGVLPPACSPHPRGWSRTGGHDDSRLVLLLAPAGMVPSDRPRRHRAGAHPAPRTRGDGPLRVPSEPGTPSCSPHPRGWSRSGARSRCGAGLLPAPQVKPQPQIRPR